MHKIFLTLITMKNEFFPSENKSNLQRSDFQTEINGKETDLFIPKK